MTYQITVRVRSHRNRLAHGYSSNLAQVLVLVARQGLLYSGSVKTSFVVLCDDHLSLYFDKVVYYESMKRKLYDET
jgi:hypothetical protein